MTNTFINEYQRKKRSREVLDAASAEQDATDGVLVHADSNERHSPERTLLDRSVSDDVQRALEALPDDFRTAVVLCDVQGLSYKEIADIMQTPVGTVMSRLFRGRKLLAAALRDFALAEGYVRAELEGHQRTPRARAEATTREVDGAEQPIDLEKYRAARAREGSR